MGFSKISDKELYMNSDTFIAALVRGGKYVLITTNGEIEIPQSVFESLTTGITPINGVYYCFKGAIKRAWQTAGKGGSQISGTPFAVDDAVTHLYFNTSMSVEEVVPILEELASEELSGYIFMSDKAGRGVALEINEGEGFIAILVEENVVFLSKATDELQAGWNNLDENGAFDVEDFEVGGIDIAYPGLQPAGKADLWNGILISETAFAQGDPVDSHIEFKTGMQLVLDENSSFADVIGEDYVAIQNQYYYKDEIKQVFQAGNKYFAEFKSGYQTEMTADEFSAAKGE